MKVLLFAGCFVAMWCGVCFILSRASFWPALAKQFRLQDAFEGERKHYCSGSVGWVWYRGSLTIGVNQKGVYLAVMPLFAFGSPPLFIPWESVMSIKRKKQFFFFEQAVMEIGRPRITTVCIPWSFIESAYSWLDPTLIQK